MCVRVALLSVLIVPVVLSLHVDFATLGRNDQLQCLKCTSASGVCCTAGQACPGGTSCCDCGAPACDCGTKPVISGEKDALIEIFNKTGGPKWTNVWALDTDPCFDKWFGVKCDPHTGHVTSLVLSNNNLVGEIPVALGKLEALQFLYLASNGLSGAIPDVIGRLSELVHLGLDFNKLSGELPANLGNLAKLERLFLGNNNLAGSPTVLCALSNIQLLFAGSNKFSGDLDVCFCALKYLQQLGLEMNDLTGAIPASFKEGSNAMLTALYLQNNSFTGFPQALCTVNANGYLPTCDASGNDFKCPLPTPKGCCKTFNCVP